MLHIQDVHKQYKTGELVQTALDGVTLTLRDNEFVAILGPSGSGKTTLLNVIGGLDRYDSGDLIINGISTKNYTDRDWDSYRNHTIGFVFQSYNLIPHQTVLANVELALTISGISRAERRRRAIQALTDVGLGNQIHKRPNQMSGGQMQRVAIARALVNNPSILLADEPTGALDSETSVQVMELLKEVSRDRLVVMVTHNPELAEEYANRIVRVKDGRLIDDTRPCVPVVDAPPEHKNMGRASMSFFTALALSFNNLRTKKGRTILTAFAGSIGIIGIALILSLSTGFQRYIDQIQEDTLSNYPLVIQSETADMTAALAAFGAAAAEAEENQQDGVVSEQQMISQMFAQVGANDLGAFKKHLESNMEEIGHTINTVRYSYSVKPYVFLEDTSEKVVQVNPATLFGELTGSSAMSAYMDSDVFQEMIDNRALLESQYEPVCGRWPENYNELALVLSDPYTMTDYMAYTLGIRDADELKGMVEKVMNGEEAVITEEPLSWTYDDLMGLRFRLVPASDLYQYNEEYAVWENMSESRAHMRKIVENGEPLEIVGIICPKEGVSATMLSPGVVYTSALRDRVISNAKETTIVQDQLKFEDTDVFTGKRFNAEEEEEGLDFEDMITVDEDAIQEAFGGGLSEDAVAAVAERYMKEIAGSFMPDPAPAQNAFTDVFKQLSKDMLTAYIAENGDPETGKAAYMLEDAETIAADYLQTESAKEIMQPLTDEYMIPTDVFSEVYKPLLAALLTTHAAKGIPMPTALPSAVPSAEPTVAPTEEPKPEPTAAPTTEPTTEPTAEPTAAPTAEPTPVTTEAPQPAVEMAAAIVTQDLDLDDPPAATEAPELPEIPGEIELPELPSASALPLPSEMPELPGEIELPELPLPTDAPAAPEPTEAPAEPEPTEAPASPEPTAQPEIDIPDIPAVIAEEDIDPLVEEFSESTVFAGVAAAMADQMMEVIVQKDVMTKVMEYTAALMGTVAEGLQFDEDALAAAFQFNMDEEELKRLMEAMSAGDRERSAEANLRTLGYADYDKPNAISVYLIDFEAKEEFMDFIDVYNEEMELAEKEEQVISYTDVTGIMMSSVRTIVDSVSYVLIAFVAVSLIVSSIMIGIITYISVMERTKEIGILRAIGASKRNISQVFNAETFIIGLCSGLLGIGVSLALLIPINAIIHALTNMTSITAQLPPVSAVILVLLSVGLTLLGGLIPSKQAARKDPVIALRSE